MSRNRPRKTPAQLDAEARQWQREYAEQRLAEPLTRGKLIEAIGLAIALDANDGLLPSPGLRRLLEALQ